MPAPSPVRATEDRCPGALQLHQAADGWLARIRLPGGRLSADQLDEIAFAATDLGDGACHLTSRGNIQVRGLAAHAGTALAARLAAAGLLPSPARDRVRNVLASPLATGDVDHVLARLDALLCSKAGLERLSGRFLLAVDDGSRDVAAAADLAAVAEDGPAGRRGRFRVWVDGIPTMTVLRAADVAERLAGVMLTFLTHAATREGTWRVGHLSETARGKLLDALGGADRGAALCPVDAASSAHVQRLGLIDEGAIQALPPLGSAPASAWHAVAAVARRSPLPCPVRLTPWRTVILMGLDEPGARAALQALADNGFAVGQSSPWHGVTACAGRPGCSRSRSDVRAEAVVLAAAARAEEAPTGPGSHPAYPIHVAGCERRCGRPHGPHVGIVATAEGAYETTVHPPTPRTES